MEGVVEVGGWEHACCGPAYERNEVVRVFLVEGSDLTSAAVAADHEVGHRPLTRLAGRVTNLQVQHTDGTTEEILRVPSGRALRGFDDVDDGWLQTPWDQQPVLNDSDVFLISLIVD